ncbi:MAG: NAD(P)/FAD-dependent oxidoreductase [Pseudonocardia sp.]|nr:NAD(P)/FAD-dependent oxidoreductase [Pseudonocardia sp.]
MNETSDFDVIVLGGGAAGLSGALSLARARRRVLVLDAGEQRNSPAEGVHGFLTRDGIAPADLVAAGAEEVTRYGGTVRHARVTSARRDGDLFAVDTADGDALTARRLLLTTGLVDELPDLPGLRGLWGRDVLHCPYCHGHEVRDQPIGILATSAFGVHQSLLFRQWSADVTLFLHTGPNPTDEEREQLAARGIAVVEGEVVGLEITGGRLAGIRLASGRVVPRAALVVMPRFTARDDLLDGLGLTVAEHPMGVGTHVEADQTGRTSAPGVWAAGNVVDPMAQVVAAAAAGVMAGAAVNADLIAEETRLAVEELRARPHGHPAGNRSSEDHAEGCPESHTENHTEAAAWDARYAGSDRVWSGKANDVLVRVVPDLAPGTALDLGCGEGGDAIWLARNGWRVTATDISRVAIDRAADHAAAEGVADRIDFRRRDLGANFPDGEFDLVSAHFLHSWGDLPRERILRSAAAAVAPGGALLVVGHSGFPSWETEPPADVAFPTPEEVLASLKLPDGTWEVLISDEHERTQTGPDGRPGTRTDNTLMIRRL